MTLAEFTADLDRYIERGWHTAAGDRATLLFAATFAERITADGSPEVGPGYEFVIHGDAYNWSGYDGWNHGHPAVVKLPCLDCEFYVARCNWCDGEGQARADLEEHLREALNKQHGWTM